MAGTHGLKPVAKRGCRLKAGKTDCLHGAVDVDVLRDESGEGRSNHVKVAAPTTGDQEICTLQLSFPSSRCAEENDLTRYGGGYIVGESRDVRSQWRPHPYVIPTENVARRTKA